MKVAKFGGSSLANASQIKKVASIIQNDPKIRYVVVSAPGKVSEQDVKITDLLIELTTLIKQEQEHIFVLESILNRFKLICDELDIPIFEQLKGDLNDRISSKHHKKYYFPDHLKAYGEDASAKILSAYLCKIKVDSEYISPKNIGLYLNGEVGNGQVCESSFKNIYAALKEKIKVIVIPGFFGMDKHKKTITFGRGGSDVTGAIIASSMAVQIYENYTDVDNVFAANPKIINNPRPIYEITYNEMRELTYAGFSVLHEETIIPLYKKGIPVYIKNTNNPNCQGTKIGWSYSGEPNFLTGIAGKKGFTSIYVRKFLMNKEVGFVRKLLHILEDEHLSFEHAPSGIDHITIILESQLFYSKNYQRVLNRIQSELNVDKITVGDHLAILVIVGENIVQKNILSQSSQVLEENKIKILNASLAQCGVSLVLGVNEKDLDQSIKILYHKFFR